MNCNQNCVRLIENKEPCMVGVSGKRKTKNKKNKKKKTFKGGGNERERVLKKREVSRSVEGDGKKWSNCQRGSRLWTKGWRPEKYVSS